MKHVDPTTIVTVPPMTRKQKLLRLSKIVAQFSWIANPHKWEHLPLDQRDSYTLSGSIMDIASKDPVFKDAGLTGSTVGEFCAFFEMSQSQFHDLSCFCRHGETSSGISYATSLTR